MRRGTQEAWAEVDFRGKDNLDYRARWSVHRAKSGRLQDVKMRLQDLTTLSDIGDQTKTLTKDIIVEKTGLTFDQFRRTVLLAQGDFAAFLKADVKERASLLEQMTGTDLYARISIAAHEKLSALKNKSEDCRYRIEEISESLLSDDALSEHNKELNKELSSLKQIKKEIEQSNHNLRLIRDQKELASNLKLIEEKFKAQEKEWKNLEANRDEINRVESIQAYRATLVKLHSDQKQFNDLNDSLDQNLKTLDDLESKILDLTNKSEIEKVNLIDKEKELESLDEDFQKAHELDLSLNSLEKLKQSTADKIQNYEYRQKEVIVKKNENLSQIKLINSNIINE